MKIYLVKSLYGADRDGTENFVAIARSPEEALQIGKEMCYGRLNKLLEDHSIYEIGTANDDFSAAAYVVCEDVKWG